MYVRSILAAALMAVAAAGALAASETHSGPGSSTHADGMHAMHRGFGPSVEHAAMHNIMAGLIAARTGRSEADVRAMFENSDPHEALEKLGLSRDDMHALMKQAHSQLIDKAAAAGLITADQATKLHSVQMPEPPDHDGPPPAE